MAQNLFTYNVPQNGPSSMFGPLNYALFDDFDKAYPLTSNLPVTATSPYNAIASNTGTFTQASPSDPDGVAILSGAATTTESGVQIQSNNATFQLAAGKNYELAFRIKLSDAINSDLFVGLMNNYGASGAILNGSESATILGNLDTTHWTDGVGVYKKFGQAGFYGLQFATGAATGVTPVYGLAVSAKYTIIGIQIQMTNTISGIVNFFQDGVLLQSFNSVSMPAATVNLAPVVGFLSATATGTITCALDYISGVSNR